MVRILWKRGIIISCNKVFNFKEIKKAENNWKIYQVVQKMIYTLALKYRFPVNRSQENVHLEIVDYIWLVALLYWSRRLLSNPPPKKKKPDVIWSHLRECGCHLKTVWFEEFFFHESFQVWKPSSITGIFCPILKIRLYSIEQLVHGREAWKFVCAFILFPLMSEQIKQIKSLYIRALKLYWPLNYACLKVIKEYKYKTGGHSDKKTHEKGSTLALKPRADVTGSPKQGYQWPQKKTCVLQKIIKKKKINWKTI